ncbi:MAG: HEAT repeat domain-containing protein [Pirellulales bacterium]
MRFSVRSVLLSVALIAAAVVAAVLVPAITLAIGLLGAAVGTSFSRGLVVFFVSGFLGFMGALYWRTRNTLGCNMFRYSIRGLMFFTLAVGLLLGWWLDHRSLSAAKSEAAEDARMLSWLTLPGRMLCGNEAGYVAQIREKYGAHPRETTAIMLWEDVETEESQEERDFVEVEKSALLRLIEDVSRCKSLSVVPALVQVLLSTDRDIRLACARALIGIGSGVDTVRLALQSALENDEDRDVRIVAAQGLGKLGFDAPEVMPALIAALDDTDGNVVGAAAASIAQFKHEAVSAIPALLQVLKSPATRHVQLTLDMFYERPVRYDAVEALRRVARNDERVKHAIQSVLVEERDDEVRAMAAGALYDLTKDSRLALPHLRNALKSRSEYARLLALDELKNLGSEASVAIDDAISLLGHGSAVTRQYAAEILGRIGKRAARALPSLRELAGKDPDEQVRSAAKAAIDQFLDSSRAPKD